MTTTDPTIDAGALTAAYQHRDGVTRIFLVIHVEDAERSSRILALADGAEVTVGRSRTATVFVDDERISRMHARIRRTQDVVDVEDLGSRNGTLVNGEPIAARRVLAPGDEITIGPATVVVGIASRIARRNQVADVEVFEARLAAEVDRAIRYHRRTAVVALQVIGDDAVVDAIGRSIRTMDLLGDYGGDRFVLLLPELDRDEAAAMVRDLIAEAQILSTEIRAGIAIAPDDGVSADELLDRSRAALRQARTPGALVVSATPAAVRQADRIVINPAMRRIYAMLDRIAGSNLTVLILGETGVGKELVAEAIHRGSSRRDAPLIKINCASLPASLLENELFGHERGAFTGADRRRAGFFEAASGGSLFLDEIGEMEAALQAKLLRVLERKVLTRVGGTEEVQVDVRIMAATHRDVEAEVRSGRFREDLFFRIAGFTVAIPPLRDRRDEIIPLAGLFLATSAAELEQVPAVLDAGAVAALTGYDWPGNVRELKNAIERAVVMHSGATITLDDLPERVRDSAHRGQPPPDGGIRDQLAELERDTIAKALELHGGNQTRAAQRLGISRRALIYRMEKVGLKPAPGVK